MRMSERHVWYRWGHANERDGCSLTAKITGGLVVTTVAFGRAPQHGGLVHDEDGSALLPVAYTAVARPSLCGARSAQRSGYHWGSVEQRRVAWPFSMAGLGELHEWTVARVVRGEVCVPLVCVPLVCALCRERARQDMVELQEDTDHRGGPCPC